MSEPGPQPIQVTESDRGRFTVFDLVLEAQRNGANKEPEDEVSDDSYFIEFPGQEARWYEYDQLAAALREFNNPGANDE